MFDSIPAPGPNGGSERVASPLASALAQVLPSEPESAAFRESRPEPGLFTARMVDELPSWSPPAPPEPAAPFAPPVAAIPPPSPVVEDIDWDDVDAGFAHIVSAPGGEPTVSDAADMAAIEDLFKQIAATHLVPVRDFAVELSLGVASAEWYQVCIPAVVMLRRSAEETGLSSMTTALEGLLEVLRIGESAGSATVRDADRDAIIASYDALARELPSVAPAAKERDRREPIMVQALLRQVPGVRKVALDKLFAAGLTGLDSYYRATPREIAETAGLAVALSEAIVVRFLSYRDHQVAIPPESKRAAELRELEALTRELERHNRAYDSGASGWSREAEESRRTARRERGDAVLKITLLLARLGEVDLIARLERLPFERKVAAIEEFTESARNAERAQKHRGHSNE